MFDSFRDGLFRHRSKRQLKKQIYNLTAALILACRDIALYEYKKDYKEIDPMTWQALITRYVERGMTYTDSLREQANFQNFFDVDVTTSER